MSNAQYCSALLKAETFHEGLGVLAPDLQVPTLGSLGPTSMLADSVCGRTGLKAEIRVKVKAQAGGQPHIWGQTPDLPEHQRPHSRNGNFCSSL